MKTVSVEEFRTQVDKYLADAAKDDVVLTHDGKPWIVLHGIPDQADGDETDFAQSPEFWRLIRERRKEQGIPWEEAVKSLDLS